MARLSLLYILAYLFSILVITDSIYYIAQASNNNSTSSSSTSNYPSQIYSTMSIRIIFTLAFIFSAIFFDSRPKILLPIQTAFTLVTFSLLVACSTFLQFHAFVPSLILQVLMLFLAGLCLISEVFDFYNIKNVDKDSIKWQSKR